MGFFKPNIWKLLFALLLFSAGEITIMILRFLHSCPVTTSGFVSLALSPTRVADVPKTEIMPEIIHSTFAILKTSCEVNPRVEGIAHALSLVSIALLAYLSSCIILFLPHRK